MIFPVTEIFLPVRLIAPEPVTATGPVTLMAFAVESVVTVRLPALTEPRVISWLRPVIET